MDFRFECESVEVNRAFYGGIVVRLSDVEPATVAPMISHFGAADVMAIVDPDLYLSTHTDDILAAMERAGYVVGAP